MTTNLADLLIEKINEKRNPCVVGLDPRISLIPAYMREICLQKYGDTVGEHARQYCILAVRLLMLFQT